MLDRQIIESERLFGDALKKDRCRDVMRRQLHRLITLASKLQALSLLLCYKIVLFPRSGTKSRGQNTLHDVISKRLRLHNTGHKTC